MSDEVLSFDEFDMNELSAEDLAVIQAFEAMEVWPPGPSPSQTSGGDTIPEVPQACSQQEDGEMLLVFAAEAEADISSMRQILNQLAQDGPGDPALFITLKRAGHKLHGTSGAVGFPLISTVASQVELIAEGVSRSVISPHVGIEAISAATTRLEACLQAITSASEELEAPSLLTSLEAVYQSLHIDLQQLELERAATGEIVARAETYLSSTPALHVDAQGFDHLTVSTEPLVASTVEGAHRSIFCFLVQVGDQHLLLPFQQIERIGNGQWEHTDVCYSLQELLGFSDATCGASPESTAEPRGSTSQRLLILRSEDEMMGESAGVVVDEVLGEQECIVEPLLAYLRRPGIVGTTIDGGGRVLLVVDLWGLIRFTRCK